MIVLKRGPSHEALEASRALWWPVEADGARPAIFSCPGCGKVLSLTRRWKIDADGTVTPSVDHTKPFQRTGTDLPPVPTCCAFHRVIKLEARAP